MLLHENSIGKARGEGREDDGTTCDNHWRKDGCNNRRMARYSLNGQHPAGKQASMAVHCLHCASKQQTDKRAAMEGSNLTYRPPRRVELDGFYLISMRWRLRQRTHSKAVSKNWHWHYVYTGATTWGWQFLNDSVVNIRSICLMQQQNVSGRSRYTDRPLRFTDT